MTSMREDRLHAAVWAYHSAVQRRDGIEGRLRRGELDLDLQDRSLAASESVVQARNALYRMLISEGWTPPPALAQQIEYDDSVLREQAVEAIVQPY